MNEVLRGQILLEGGHLRVLGEDGALRGVQRHPRVIPLGDICGGLPELNRNRLKSLRLLGEGGTVLLNKVSELIGVCLRKTSSCVSTIDRVALRVLT